MFVGRPVYLGEREASGVAYGQRQSIHAKYIWQKQAACVNVNYCPVCKARQF